jgi:hypothetical protein
MGKIYSNANTVLAWLGSYDQEIVETFEFMSTATSFKDSQTSVEAYCQHVRPKEFLYCRSGLRLVWERDWQSVTKVCGLGYWTRKWIIQKGAKCCPSLRS